MSQKTACFLCVDTLENVTTVSYNLSVLKFLPHLENFPMDTMLLFVLKAYPELVTN